MSIFYNVLPGLIIFVISLILIITFSQLMRKDDENKNTYIILLGLFCFIFVVNLVFYTLIYPVT